MINSLFKLFGFRRKVQLDTPYYKKTKEERTAFRKEIFDRLDIDDHELEQEEGGLIYYVRNLFSFRQEVQCAPTQLSSNVGKESRGDNAVYTTKYMLLTFLPAVSTVLYL